MNGQWLQKICLGLMAMTLVSGAVAAAEQYHAGVIEMGNATPAYMTVSTPPAIVGYVSSTWSQAGVNAEATVDRGIITDANIQVAHSDGGAAHYWALESRMKFEDIVFSAPTTGNISVRLNMYFDGFFNFTADSDNDYRAAVIATYVNFVDHGYFRPVGSDTDGNPHGAIGGGGMFAGQGGDTLSGVFTTLPFTVQSNTPQTIEIRITIDAWAGGAQNIWRRSRAQFDTISFPVGSPVFVVDPEVTVDSTEANIVNNIWMGTGSGGPGAVPDGKDVPGVPLLLTKDVGGDLSLSWSAACASAGVDYEIYEGTIGDWSDHSALECTTLNDTSILVTMPTESHYYLVVPTDGNEEGSYGRDSTGAERMVGIGVCLPQALDTTCP